MDRATVNGPHVCEDPDASVATLVAILNAHPQARVRAEVTHSNPGLSQVSEASADRAARVAEVFVRNGLSTERIESAGVNTPASQVPRTYLVVTDK